MKLGLKIISIFVLLLNMISYGLEPRKEVIIPKSYQGRSEKIYFYPYSKKYEIEWSEHNSSFLKEGDTIKSFSFINKNIKDTLKELYNIKYHNYYKLQKGKLINLNLY